MKEWLVRLLGYSIALFIMEFISFWVSVGDEGQWGWLAEGTNVIDTLGVLTVIAWMIGIIGSWKKNEKGYRRDEYFLNKVMSLWCIGLIISTVGLSYYYSSFTTMKWKTNRAARHFMIEDVKNKYNGFISMTKQEVENILGEPDTIEEKEEYTFMSYLIEVNEWEWWVEKYLTLKLNEKDRVIQVF